MGSRWKDYVTARNECVNIMRIEKQNYEKDKMVKCKSDPRLFYRHINPYASGDGNSRSGGGLRVAGVPVLCCPAKICTPVT